MKKLILILILEQHPCYSTDGVRVAFAHVWFSEDFDLLID